jgi:hypothetical protein
MNRGIMTSRVKICLPAAAIALCFALVFPLSASVPASDIQLNVSGAGPREVEDTVQESVRRDYAQAWQTMEAALESGDASGLHQYWVGVAHDKLAQKMKDEAQTKVRVRYQGKSHRLQAIYYPTDGAALLLHDDAEVELQVLDGGKLVHSQTLHQKYVVLMTPGQDRWFVRLLQAVPGF